MWWGSREQHATPKKKLSVAVEASYAPFEYKDEDGHIIGFDVDLMKQSHRKWMRRQSSIPSF